MSPEIAKHERLFFALWPPDTVRQQIVKRLNSLSGLPAGARLVTPVNLHMTLHFLGNINKQSIDCYIQQAREVKISPFELQLSEIGFFQKPKVVWLGCDGIPPQLVQLQYDLGGYISHCGFQIESRPFHPHVTLARKIYHPVDVSSLEPVSWTVDAFVLVKSITCARGVEYQVRELFD